ncbi:hypothetical protein FHU38_005013 [Saccharomonospora amisosensis]|uniref:Uncharacterized protein n=1 Tax=Saccharomonospora amisosensis TaxID=1128677 RepID=A0A7X5UUQ2_9PSEU|nr:hypothetical protein [Saccharomonospora amisosensis]NIJ14612.1 hypothetical protein [Saccharomonospora amisosensis]
MAPNVPRCTPTDADLLDRTGIITASLPAQRQVETALDDHPEAVAPHGVHRSRFAGVTVAFLMLIVAVSAVVDRDIPTPSGVAVGEQRQPTVVSVPATTPPRAPSTTRSEPRRPTPPPTPKPQAPPPRQESIEPPVQPVVTPKPATPTQPEIERPKPDVRPGSDFAERVRDLIGPALDRYEHERFGYLAQADPRSYGDLLTYSQRWRELFSIRDW